MPSGPRVDGVMSVLIGTAAPLIDPEKFRSWIMHENDHLLVLNKPAQIVCHPSKRGPRSSLAGAVTVDQPLGPDPDSCVTIKSKVVAPGTPGAQPAVTHFEPVAHGGGYTLTRIRLETGRKHQIRAHAHWIGHSVVGDKLYGPDERLYLEFAQQGWTERHAAILPLQRQALHCAEIDLRPAGRAEVFRAPLPEDLRQFCRGKMDLADGKVPEITV